MDAPSLLVGQVDGSERRSDPARCQRAGIAVGEHVAAFGEQIQSVLADAAAHRAVLLPNRGRFDFEPLPEGRAVAGRLGGDAPHAIERPPQIDGRRPGRAEQRDELIKDREKRGAWRGTQIARAGDKTHRRRNPDQRRPAYL